MKKTVFVTAIGSFSASSVLESLKQCGCRTVGCDIYPAEWVANALFADVFYQAPYATDRAAYQQFIRTVCAQEQVDFIMPLTDVEVDLFRGWETAEEETGAVICMSDRHALAVCRDKRALEVYLEPKHICNTIPGKLLSEVREESESLGFEDLEYPLVVKPIDGRSSQGLRMVHSAQEMAYAVECCKAEAERYLVQPKVDGPVITVDVVRDPVSGAVVCMPRKELLRTLNGAGTSVFVFKNAHLEKQCRDIAAALHIRGCVNFEFVEEKAPETAGGPGVWRFLECNPRFAGGLGFSQMAGYDMVKNHLNCFLGEPIEPEGEIRDQHIARRYVEYRMD